MRICVTYLFNKLIIHRTTHSCNLFMVAFWTPLLEDLTHSLSLSLQQYIEWALTFNELLRIFPSAPTSFAHIKRIQKVFGFKKIKRSQQAPFFIWLFRKQAMKTVVLDRGQFIIFLWQTLAIGLKLYHRIS